MVKLILAFVLGLVLVSACGTTINMNITADNNAQQKAITVTVKTTNTPDITTSTTASIPAQTVSDIMSGGASAALPAIGSMTK